jgi:teichuronic acid biosynthesis glycosyltransferase TuaC
VRILSFSYCYPSAARPTWGVFVAQRLHAMARRAEVEVVSPAPVFPGARWLRGAPGPLRDEWGGLAVHRPRFLCVPGILKNHDARLYARGVRKWLARRCRDRRADILDAHFVWPDGVGVSILAREAGIPYSITLRGRIYPCLEVPSQKRQCAEALARADAVISVDGAMARIAVELGARKDRVHVIPNGVDMERFRIRPKAEARAALGLPLDGRLLVTVAHLGPRKGHREAISALASLPQDVRLAIVGGDGAGGRNEKALRALAAKAGVASRVIFAGPQPYDRVPLYFSAADCSVLASYREGCPNAVLESLASGTPAVATPVGGVPDMIVPGVNGATVPVAEVAPLSAALRAALERSWDPAAVSASPCVKSWDAVAREVIRVLGR